MNAYELTKELNKFMTEDEYTDLDKAIFMASNMLRQQADRIDKLEREAIAKNNYLEQHCEKIDQQADRIAELEKDLVLKTRDRDVFCNFTLAYEKRIEELEKLEQDFIRVIKQTNPNKPQTKPLSDEEITKIRQATKANSTENWADTLAFARAILRKAQEK